MRKLQDSEAERLAVYLVRIGRPRTADEQAEMEYWLGRLRGGKS